MDIQGGASAEPLGVIRDYDDLITALRGRMQQLGTTHEELDDLSGVQSGYSAKLLGPKRIKNFGPMSYGPILAALQVKLVVVEDKDAARIYAARLRKRRYRQKPFGLERIPWLINAGNAREMAIKANAVKYASRSRRKKALHRKIARNALLIRWERVRAAAKAPMDSFGDTDE